MKRIFSFAAVAAALFALSACSSSTKQQGTEADETVSETVTQTYTGVLPAADADGVQYTVVLDYTGDNAGQYDMTQVYMMGDSTVEFTASGDFVKANDATTGKPYLKLSGTTPIDDVYFVIATDSTIVMADGTLATPDTPGMNYTLTATK